MLLACPPSPELLRDVEMLWYCEQAAASHARERVLPIGRFQLVIDLTRGTAFVIGLRTRHSTIETAVVRTMMGGLFRRSSVRRFFDLPADELRDRAVPLDMLWGSNASALIERLRSAQTAAERFSALERELRRVASRSQWEVHPAVHAALHEFHRRAAVQRVGSVAHEAGISRRRFAELFREQVGLTPKLYCRLLRFRQAVERIAAGRPVDWTEVALDGGYADQSHFIHEFKEFSGLSPGAYLACSRPSLNHVLVD